MATNAKWTVIFDDKIIIKKYAEGANNGLQYKIENDTFWNDPTYSNIWAIQYGTSVSSDEVEYRDETPHSSFADANIGSFQNFIDKWDEAHLIQMQQGWDNSDRDLITGEIIENETEAEKIARIGSRPTSYSSSPA